MNTYEKLNQWERAYLCALLSGGEVQDIKLLPSNEALHEKIKALRVSGMVDIPAGLVSENLSEYVAPENAEGLAEEIRRLVVEFATENALAKERSGSAVERADSLAAELDAIRADAGGDRLISGEELNNMEFPPRRYVVEDVIPRGLTVIAGAPKMGKTWFTLTLASCVATGMWFLGNRSNSANVLYYCLEDGWEGSKNRMRKINNGYIPQNIFFRERLRKNISVLQDIKKTGAALVFIDTFVAYVNVEDMNSYGETTRKTRELKEIADTCGVAIVLIHHTRKDSKKDDWVNALMGSQGIAGAADAILYLNRERFAKKGVLYITGRTVKDNTINMSFDEGIWEVDRGASGKNSGRA